MKRSVIVSVVAIACCFASFPPPPARAADTAESSATSAAQRAESWQQHRKLMDTSPFKHLEWRSVGPRKQGGRIEAIAAPPGNTGTLYVGPGAGNLWKTVNNGTTWKPIFDTESSYLQAGMLPKKMADAATSA